ncbi:MAG: gluconate 2-dehydrogenase subunit 3 family protein [Rhodanobacteraceae bacterium]
MAFEALSVDQQDAVLHGLEKGGIDLHDAPAKDFFTMLLQNTQEGFLADPMYGGNRDFAGWKLIGFPGPRYNYVAEIEQYGKPYTMPTVGLKGRGSPGDQKD